MKARSEKTEPKVIIYDPPSQSERVNSGFKGAAVVTRPRSGKFTWSPRQTEAREFLLGPQRFSTLVGGTRSAKTTLIVRNIIIRALKAPETNHAMFRYRTNAAKRSLWLDTVPKVFKNEFPNIRWKPYAQAGFIELIDTGSRLFIDGLDDKDRVDKVLGNEFLTVFLNEASQIAYRSALTAFGRIAQVSKTVVQRGFIDLNPTNKSHWTNRVCEGIDPISGKPLVGAHQWKRFFLNPKDNAANLTPEYLEYLRSLPPRERQRMYEGVYGDEGDNALWSIEILAATRVGPYDEDDRRAMMIFINELRPKLASIVVSVDPSGASGKLKDKKKEEKNDEVGIVVVARGDNGHGYVLEDLSRRCGPREWAKLAVDAYYKWGADSIVAEVNFGGAMVTTTIENYDSSVSVHQITSKQGKHVRAEPVSVAYSRDLIHHVGYFPKLEQQLCGFTTAGYEGEDNSPDRADAAIHGLRFLLGSDHGTGIIDYYRMLNEGIDPTTVRTDVEAPLPKLKPPPATIRLIAPPHVTTAYDITGKKYDVVEGILTTTDRETAKSFLQSGTGWSLPPGDVLPPAPNDDDFALGMEELPDSGPSVLEEYT